MGWIKPGMQFDEQALYEGNVFKHEQRLLSQTNKYIENNAILTTYWNLQEDATTVDRGLQDIDQLFGKQSPLRYHKIENFPIYGFQMLTPENTDEGQAEDLNIVGECQIIPNTIMPKQDDVFIVNHLKQMAIFRIMEVSYDSMKREGFYKIRYRLHSTSPETLEQIEAQTINVYKTQLDALGTQVNPIIQKDDAVKRSQLTKIVEQMIMDYRAMYYSSRHNCFLYKVKWERWFDLCANEFMAKHSIMNIPNSTQVIVLNQKLHYPKLPITYQQSIYRWIEDGAPIKNIHKFPFTALDGTAFKASSFNRWGETDIKIIVPDLEIEAPSDDSEKIMFPSEQLKWFKEKGTTTGDPYDAILKKYIQGDLEGVRDVSLDIGDALAAAHSDYYSFFLTPIIIYIIRHALKLN